MKPPRYKNVQVKIHSDRRFRSLSAPPPNAQSLLFRLLTAPEGGSIPGLVPIGEAALAEALGWPVDGLRTAFAELDGAGYVRADWKARLIWVPEAWEHDRPRNPDTIRGWRRQLEEITDCPLKDEARAWLGAQVAALGEHMRSAFDQAWPTPSRTPCPPPSSTPSEAPSTTRCPPQPGHPPPAPNTFHLPPSTQQETLSTDAVAPPTSQSKVLPLLKAQEPPVPDPAETVFQHWRKAMRKNAAPQFDEKRQRQVRKQLKAGRTVAELCRAIDGCAASAWHMENRQTDLSLICRDADHVEKFMAFADNPPRPTTPSRVTVAGPSPLPPGTHFAGRAPDAEQTAALDARWKAEFARGKKPRPEEIPDPFHTREETRGP